MEEKQMLTINDYPEFEREGVNVIVGDSIGKNVTAAIRHGYNLSRTGEGNVLYIDTVETNKQLENSMRKVMGPPLPEDKILNHDPNEPTIYFETVHHGELAKQRYMILDYIRYKNVTSVIVNSWEFACNKFQDRQDVLFLFQELTEGVYINAASVLVYAQAPAKDPIAGMLQRGGLGKLAGMARMVTDIRVKSEVRRPMSEVGGGSPIRVGEKSSPTSDVRSRGREVGSLWSQMSEVINNFEVQNVDVEEVMTSDFGLQTSDFPMTSDIGHRTSDIPIELARMPIHQNSFSPDKKPYSSERNRAPVLNIDVLDKKEVTEVTKRYLL